MIGYFFDMIKPSRKRGKKIGEKEKYSSEEGITSIWIMAIKDFYREPAAI